MTTLPLLFFFLSINAQEFDQHEPIGTVDFVRCVDCNERVLFLPSIEFENAPAGRGGFSGRVSIEVDIDDTGNVVWTKRISGNTKVADWIAGEVLAARFIPKIDSKLQVGSKEVLEFEFSPGKVRDLNKQLPILNAATESMPYPKYEKREDSGCSSEKLEVLIRFNRLSGRVFSARHYSGDPKYAEAVETAALTVKMRHVSDQDTGNSVEEGILVYLGPKGTKCRVIMSCFPGTRAIDLVVPKYPPAAIALKLKGAVSVSILIDEEGRVIQAIATTGERLLHKSAEEAALKSSFTPTTLSGRPVKVRGIIVYNFQGRE